MAEERPLIGSWPPAAAAILCVLLMAAARAQSCEGATRCGKIVFDGDSISAGWGASAENRPDRLLQRSLRVPAIVENVAVGGRPVQTCLELFQTNVSPRFIVGASFNLIIFHAGDNDIALGQDAVSTYRSFGQYVKAAHQQGWKVVVSTELPRPDFGATKEAALNGYNRLLIANAAGADAVVDLSQDIRLNAPEGRTASGMYSHDQIHPNDTGYAVMIRLLTPSVSTLIGRPGTFKP